MKRVTSACLVLLLVFVTGRAEDGASTRTIRFQLWAEQTLVFRRVSPTAHGIHYPDYFALETEVTNAQFKVYLDGAKKTKDDTEILRIIEERIERRVASTGDIPYRIEDQSTIWRDGAYPEELADHPVALVTVHDAADFCDWLTNTNPTVGLFRLPTWNEWVIAAYGKSRAYPWGDAWQTNRVHTSYGFKRDYSVDTRPKRTEPVKSRPQGRSPEGLYGLLGNVSEYIVSGDPTNRSYFNLGSRWMGGGFTSGPSWRRETDRIPPRKDYWGYSHHATARECDLGFRVILDPSKDLGLLKRPRVFEQKDKSWTTATDTPKQESDSTRKGTKKQN